MIAAAAIGTGPIYTQDLYRTRNELEDDGFSEPDISKAMDLYGRRKFERTLIRKG